MAKKKILTIEHVDSFFTTEVAEDVFNGYQDRIKAKYKIKSTKEAADTPAEAVIDAAKK